MNVRLCEAIDASKLSELAIAEKLGVSQKTVERWMAGRVPYPRFRRALADALGVDECKIWAESTRRKMAGSEDSTANIQAVYAHRWAVPREVWLRLFAAAEHEIGVLAYAALFLVEDDGMIRTLTEKAQSGVRIRVLLGDPDSNRVAERGTGEGIGDAIAAKVRNALALYRPLTRIKGIEIRLHDTTLYASIYRSDNNALVNTHAYGVPASHAPVISLQHVSAGDMADVYFESFNRVWRESKNFD